MLTFTIQSFTMKNSFKGLLLSVLVILLHVIPANGITNEDEKCLSCHDKVYNKAMQSFYIHRPFLDKKCIICHGGGENTSSSRPKPGRITWLQKHYEPASTHFFLIPSEKVNGTLFVRIKGKGNRSKITTLTLPPIGQLKKLRNDGQKPVISNIYFHGVKHGILYSAVISWETDEPTDAQIQYGIGKFNSKSDFDHQLKTHHTVSIAPLSPGKTYHYAVMSQDIHGNKTISQPFTFTTETPEDRNPPAIQSSPGKKPSYQLWAVKDQYFISITVDQATYMSIGRNDDLRLKRTVSAKDKKGTPPATHMAMKNAIATNITACLTCHTDYQSDSSHPINVGPKKGMIFPEDYPVFANGKMHCMTCHDSHASNNEARIRRPTKQELCIGCHKSYG